MPKREELEHRALQIITANGDEGILQCHLWREMGASGRDGSRISLKLENKNLIRRERELYEGRWSYRIFTKKRPIEIDSILDIPCVFCENVSKCDAGSEVSPNACTEMTRWLLSFKGDSEGENPTA